MAIRIVHFGEKDDWHILRDPVINKLVLRTPGVNRNGFYLVGFVPINNFVAANQAIGGALTQLAENYDFEIRVPPPNYCTDNAAMIAWAGLERYALGKRDPLDVSPRARWPLASLDGERHGGQDGDSA